MMLMFNEILECKFWRLNINLEKNINKRQIEDFLEANERDINPGLEDNIEKRDSSSTTL